MEQQAFLHVEIPAVKPKTEIAHVGSWAIFRDPARNEVGLFNRIVG